MRRRLAVLLSPVVTATTVTVLISAPPAAAATVCAGLGIMQMTAAFSYPMAPEATTVAPPQTTRLTLKGASTASFVFALGAGGGCVPQGELTAVGTVSGYCGHAAGQGITAHGHRFGFTTVGDKLVFTGGMVGFASIAPHVFNGHSCFTSASEFLITGTVVEVPCNVIETLQAGSTLLFPGVDTATTIGGATVHLNLAAQSAHWSVHPCLGV